MTPSPPLSLIKNSEFTGTFDVIPNALRPNLTKYIVVSSDIMRIFVSVSWKKIIYRNKIYPISRITY